MDNDSSTYFVDLTPLDPSDYRAHSTRAVPFGGELVNAEQFHFDAVPGSAAATHHDLYSIALHELGHSLGFVAAYPRYDTLDPELPVFNSHLDLTLPPPPGHFSSGPYYPTSLGPTLDPGSRRLLTGLDILTLADLQDLDSPNLPIPEPRLGILLTLSLLALFGRRDRPRKIARKTL